MSDSNPCVAKGAGRSPAQSALGDQHEASFYSINVASLPVPQYNTGYQSGSGVQYQGGKLPDYQMPVISHQPHQVGTNIPFTPRDDEKIRG